MSDSEDWASAIPTADILLDLNRKKDSLIDDARVIVEKLTDNMLLFAPMIEVFSNRKPIYAGDPLNDDVLPIDIREGQSRSSDQLVEFVEWPRTTSLVCELKCVTPVNLLVRFPRKSSEELARRDSTRRSAWKGRAQRVYSLVSYTTFSRSHRLRRTKSKVPVA